MQEHQGEETTTDTPPAQVHDWKRLVERIQAGAPEGMEELYSVFGRGVRFYLYRQLGPQELEDRVHDTFLIVLQAIKNGDIRDPDRLMGFVRTVLRRRVASRIDEIVRNRREHTTVETELIPADEKTSPEEEAIVSEHTVIIQRILQGLNGRDREILTRFYLNEQSQEQICADMHLTATQFRLLKYRAKARFGELGRRLYGAHFRAVPPADRRHLHDKYCQGETEVPGAPA